MESPKAIPWGEGSRERTESTTWFLYRMIAKGGWVYMMSSHSRCLYIGVTSDLGGRVWEHKNGVYPGFTKKYKINLLIYYELFHDIEDAIAQRNN